MAEFRYNPMENEQADRLTAECDRCIERVRQGAEGLRGVHQARWQPGDRHLWVEYDPGQTHPDDLQASLNQIACQVQQDYGHEVYDVYGMDCPRCALKLETSVGKVTGVLWVSVNFATGKMAIEYDRSQPAADQIQQLAKRMGYPLTETSRLLARPGEATGGWWQWLRRQRGLLPAGMGGAILLAGWLLQLGDWEEAAVWAFAAALLSAGHAFAWRGLAALRLGVLGTDLLMTVAAMGAALLGEWTEAALVAFLYSLGNGLEAYSMDKARRSLETLLGVSQRTVQVERRGRQIDITPQEVEIGDLLQVRPGERIGADGRIKEGKAWVDESTLTGEPQPVSKGPGDAVFAGTVSTDGALQVEALKPGRETLLARILLMVQEAQAHKSRLQRLSERFGQLYTPVVVGSAAAVALLPPLILGGHWSYWIYKALLLTVVACPCALVISIPVAAVCAISNAARHGLLAKGSLPLERLAQSRTLAFDKTGTLTLGLPELVEIATWGPLSQQEALRLAAALEIHSEHPVAQTLVRAAHRQRLGLPKANNIKTLPGLGIQGEIAGEGYYVGSARLAEALRFPLNEGQDILRQHQGREQTTLFLMNRTGPVAALLVEDTVRPTAGATVERLHQLGIRPIVMLTGDPSGAAQRVGSLTGVDEIHAGLLPEEKGQVVRQLQQQYGPLVMVGDGINDAPALAAAEVGIAMGVAGTDIALETADIALMSSDIARIPMAISLSRALVAVMRQNLLLSLAMVVVLLAGVWTPWLKLSAGVLGHEGSALWVILNSLRLLHWRPR